jgi:hypothetical protein
VGLFGIAFLFLIVFSKWRWRRFGFVKYISGIMWLVILSIAVTAAFKLNDKWGLVVLGGT